MDEPTLIGFVVGTMLVFVVALPVVLTRKGGHLVKRRPTRLMAWSSPLLPYEALQAAIDVGKKNSYAVDVEAEGCVVLRSSLTPFTWGFFFPIYAARGADGRTRVEVGIASRFVQVGPLVTRAHNKLMAELGAPLQLSPLP
jgi:hypothetical protein